MLQIIHDIIFKKNISSHLCHQSYKKNYSNVFSNTLCNELTKNLLSKEIKFSNISTKKKDKKILSKNFLVHYLVDLFNRQNIFFCLPQENNTIKKKNDQNNILHALASLTHIDKKILKIKKYEKNIKFLKHFSFKHIDNKKDKNHSNKKIIFCTKNYEKNIHIANSYLHDTSMLNADKKNINFAQYSKNILPWIKEIKKYIKSSKLTPYLHKNIFPFNNTIQKISSLKKLDKDKYLKNATYPILDKNIIKWKKAISQQILFFICKKENIAIMQVAPKALGLIDIQIKINNNKATVNFLSHCNKIKNILHNAIPFLKSSLQKHDIKIDHVNIHSPMILNSQGCQSHYSNGKYNQKEILNIKYAKEILSAYQKNIKYYNNQNIDVYV